MMEYQKLFEKITKQYSEKIFGWAINKTFSRDKGEELAQDVFCAIFTALIKSPKIENLDAYIWRIAHHTWCNCARKHQKEKVIIGFDEGLLEINEIDENLENIAEQMALSEELCIMRKELANLNRLQRDCMIFYYLDGLSVAQVAMKLDTTESTVKWHLFDSRNKLKKELISMQNDNQRIYRPGKLGVALSGSYNGELSECDTGIVSRSLIMQNICLLCYREPKTIDDIAECTGISKPYFESDLNWLLEHEFLIKKGIKYYTDFIIYGWRSWQLNQGVFADTRKEYVDIMLDFLIKNEKKIRDIGFYGSDMPYSRLMWPLIMIFAELLEFFSPSRKKIRTEYEYPLRKDGGNYEPLHMDGRRSFWIGIYDILKSGNFDYVFNYDKYGNITELYCECGKGEVDISAFTDKQKEHLALAVEKGWVKKDGNYYHPQFPIFTFDQFNQLTNLFKPFFDQIEPQTEKVINNIEKVFRDDAPSQIKNKSGFVISNMFSWLNFMMMMFAYEKGLLTVPDDCEQKRITTLLLVDKKI
jgi:RNA polymerase sigma factor (sigma-70 family)